MELISFGTPSVCHCQKRPSANIKSPYVADIVVHGEELLGHCPSLGLGGILVPGVEMIATPSSAASKTDYVIQAVKDGDTWVGNVPLHANRIVKQLLELNMIIDDVATVTPEHRHGESRLDFLVTQNDGTRVYCEVKSVHIKVGNDAVFPVGYKKRRQDTVSERANRHLTELGELAKSGRRAMAIFVVQRDDCDTFSPNWDGDPIFSNLLRSVMHMGVEVKVVYTSVSQAGIYLRHINELKQV